jgi:hypothetical protein
LHRAKLDPDFIAGKKALFAQDWNGAIAVLESAALRDPLGQIESAESLYRKGEPGL